MWLSKPLFVHYTIIKKGNTMGKMKEIYNHYFNEHPDASDAEYQDWLHSNGLTTATQHDKESQHDAWWNSLTNDHKQKLYDDQVAFDELAIELSIEEMNHDLGFGK